MNSEKTPVDHLVMRLCSGDRVADAKTRQDLRDAAKMINDLWKRLQRANPVCEHMHHEKSEYHKSGPCPVEAWVRDGFSDA